MTKKAQSSTAVTDLAKRRVQSNVIAYFGKFNFLGLLFGVIAFSLSVTPSLLPRTSIIQGMLTGLSIVIAYGLGVTLSMAIRWSIEYEIPHKYKIVAWKVLFVFGTITILVFTWLAKVWHDEVQRLVGLPPETELRMIEVGIISLVVALLMLAIARIIKKFLLFLFHRIDYVLPRRLSFLISMIIVIVLIYWVVSGLFVNTFIAFANTFYSERDSSIPHGYSQPLSPLRSGSTESLSSWDTIGYQGRKFVAGGPNKANIQEVMGESTAEPVRVYVGLKAAETAEQRAALAVQEMERTGAFSRPVLVLATTTGSGWLQPSAVDTIEYMYGGNTAIVSQQYSYLPSWISYLVDKQTATEAGQALFDAVYGKWMQLPKESRPKLYAYGLSLGSFGGQTPYSGVNDFRFTVDGALFVGTPNFTSLWRNITKNRDTGTPEWLPVYRNGETVRFAHDNQSVTTDQSKWTYPRLLYIQHASDPVVWFDFSLIDKKPDWLKEKRGPDVSPATRWFPIVTFLQLGIDQISAGNVPVGHGHMYGDSVVNSWVSVTNPSNWNDEKTAKLQNYIDANY